MFRPRWPVLALMLSVLASPFLAGCDYDEHEHRDRDARWHDRDYHHDYDHHDWDHDRERW